MKYYTGDRVRARLRFAGGYPDTPRLGRVIDDDNRPGVLVRLDGDGAMYTFPRVDVDPIRPDVGDRCRTIAAGDTYHPGVVEKYGGGLYTVRFDDGGLFGREAVDLIAIGSSEEKPMENSSTTATTIGDEDEARDVVGRLITTFNRVEDRYERLRKIEAKYARLLRSLDTEGEFGVLDLPPLLIHSIKLRREANLNRMRDLALKLNDLA